MIGFRQADPRFPFLWESREQPAGRWHSEGEGPAHYVADTPDGAWAEFLRHEEITDPGDLPTIRRAMWAIDLGPAPTRAVTLPAALATGDRDSYARCQAWARRARAAGAQRLRAPSAALVRGGATGWVVRDGQRPAAARGGRVIVVFGPPARLVGWQVVAEGSPPPHVLPRVRHYGAAKTHVAKQPSPPEQSPKQPRGAS